MPRILVLSLMLIAPISFAENFTGGSAVAVAEVFADKARRCKDFYKYNIESFFEGCEFLNKNYYQNKNDRFKQARKWALEQLKTMDESDPNKDLAIYFLDYANDFKNSLTYIEMKQ
jgi:hypothetical protein